MAINFCCRQQNTFLIIRSQKAVKCISALIINSRILVQTEFNLKKLIFFDTCFITSKIVGFVSKEAYSTVIERNS